MEPKSYLSEFVESETIKEAIKRNQIALCYDGEELLYLWNTSPKFGVPCMIFMDEEGRLLHASVDILDHLIKREK